MKNKCTAKKYLKYTLYHVYTVWNQHNNKIKKEIQQGCIKLISDSEDLYIATNK